MIFDTSQESRKFKNIQKSPEVSLVIGWENERTVQYEGLATLLSAGEELDRLKRAYFKKVPKLKNGKIRRVLDTSKSNLYGYVIRT